MMPMNEMPKSAEKPFFCVPLAEDDPDRKSPPPHDRFEDWTGQLGLEIEVMSEYLHVGSGNFGLFNLKGTETAYYGFTRYNGQLAIPGTSIKGAVRSIVEAISNSCVRQVAKGERAPHHKACEGTTDLCPACRLFGTTGYGGRIHFSDAFPMGKAKSVIIKIADLWRPRQAKGRKFYYAKSFQRLDLQPVKNHRFIEAVTKGTKFFTVLYFENCSNAEMGLLMHAIGLDLSHEDDSVVEPIFPIKLGGAKPRCLGAALIIPKQLRLVPSGPQVFLAVFGGGIPSPLVDKVRTWLGDSSLLDAKAWQVFRAQASPKEELCPQGMY